MSAAMSALELRLNEEELALLHRPAPCTFGANSSSIPYADERSDSHPVGAAMAPWRNTAHLGPTRCEEAAARAIEDPNGRFVREELQSLCMHKELAALPLMRQSPTLSGDGLDAHWHAATKSLRKVGREAADSDAGRAAICEAAASCLQDVAGISESVSL